MSLRLPDAVKKARGTLNQSDTAAGRAKRSSEEGGIRGRVWIIPKKCPDPTASEWFSAAWAELAPAVNLAGCASRSDLPSFRCFVEARGLAMRSREQLEREGLTLVSDTGSIKAHPVAATWAQAQKAVAMWAQRFSLTPIDRDRAVPLGSGEADATDEFLFRGGPIPRGRQ